MVGQILLLPGHGQLVPTGHFESTRWFVLYLPTFPSCHSYPVPMSWLIIVCAQFLCSQILLGMCVFPTVFPNLIIIYPRENPQRFLLYPHRLCGHSQLDLPSHEQTDTFSYMTTIPILLQCVLPNPSSSPPGTSPPPSLSPFPVWTYMCVTFVCNLPWIGTLPLYSQPTQVPLLGPVLVG